MNTLNYIRSLPLTEALFWYIENRPEDQAEATALFFALRERYRDEYQSSESEPPVFPTMMRKMWSGGDVQRWIEANLLPKLTKRGNALKHIVNVLGPKAPPCCQGCEWEWTEALNTARAALDLKEPTDETPQLPGLDAPG